MLDKLFQYISSYPMPLWLAMMFLPNNKLTKRLASSSGVFGFAAVNYLITIFATAKEGGKVDFQDFTTLDGLSKMLGTKPGTLGAWSHMIALDLFTGAWVYRQCQKLGAPAIVRVVALFFTLMMGPFGLLIFLVWRFTLGKQPERLATE